MRELTTAQAASLLGFAPARVGGALLQISRVLDAEGYEVLLLDGGVVGLDKAALREQCGIGSGQHRFRRGDAGKSLTRSVAAPFLQVVSTN